MLTETLRSVAPLPAPSAARAEAPAHVLAADLSRFQIVVLTFLRARQLQNGARPRVDGPSRRPTRVALREVMADMISWDVTPKKEAILGG